jgi:hypothetical protein
LMKQDMTVGIDTTGNDNRGHFPRLAPQRFRLLPYRERMEVNDAIQAFVVGLQGDPVPDGAKVIAKSWDSGRLDPREYALHGP